MKLINYFLTGLIWIIKSPFYFCKYFLIGFITIITIIPHYLIIGFKYIFEKNEKQESKTDTLQNRFIPIITITLSLTTYLICIFLLSRWYVQNERTKNFTNSLKDFVPITEQDPTNSSNQYEDTANEVPQGNNNTNISQSLNDNFINVNLNYYIAKNPETVAWIQVNGTNVNYPVVQHNDNNYYLEHDFYQRKTNIGWIFADYRNDLQNFNNNTIIYGHNLVNKTMFGSIPNLLNSKWFSNPNKQYIKLSTTTTNSIWQIFSVYKIEPTTDYLQAKFNSFDTYETFLNTLKNRSEHHFNVDLINTDKILTLSTCDNTGTKRVAVHAKLIKIENK